MFLQNWQKDLPEISPLTASSNALLPKPMMSKEPVRAPAREEPAQPCPRLQLETPIHCSLTSVMSLDGATAVDNHSCLTQSLPLLPALARKEAVKEVSSPRGNGRGTCYRKRVSGHHTWNTTVMPSLRDCLGIKSGGNSAAVSVATGNCLTRTQKFPFSTCKTFFCLNLINLNSSMRKPQKAAFVPLATCLLLKPVSPKPSRYCLLFLSRIVTGLGGSVKGLPWATLNLPLALYSCLMSCLCHRRGED